MSEILRFTTNIPEEVALRFRDGKQVQSRIEGAPDQMMYSLADDRIMYVPLHIAERIRDLNIQPGERFTVCKAEVKDGQRRRIEWQVKRVDPDPRWQNPTGRSAAPPRSENGAPEPAASSVSKDAGNSTPPAKGKANGHANGKGNEYATIRSHATRDVTPYWEPKTELLRCYDDAINVLTTARDHAASQGLPVQFTGEDLRQVAATLYIDAGKTRRCPNGGAR